MADHTKIEWTDATWNIITGCAIESPGCKNCYAMKLAGTRLRNHPSRAGLTQDSAAGPVWTGEVRFNSEWLRQPLEWKRGRRIFPVAHGDLFKVEVPDAWLDLIFVVMAITVRRHTYQCLTKRPARALEYLRGLHTDAGRMRLQAAARSLGYTFEFNGAFLMELPLPNVLIGSSVEDQRYADLRRPFMREIAGLGWSTWVSYEPALGPVDWSDWGFIDWMVSGGESGADARPHHPAWHQATRDFCGRQRIAYHFKQWGAWMPIGQQGSGDGPGCSDFPGYTKAPHCVLQLDGEVREAWPVGAMLMRRIGKKAAGRLLDGIEHNGFPEVR